MKEIKIQNTNLCLKVMDIGGTTSYSLGSDKRRLRYQFVVTEESSVNSNYSVINPIFTYGVKSISFKNSDSKRIFLLIKEKKRFSEDIKLSLEDSIDVLKFLKEFAYYYPLQSEPLVMALRDKKVLESYQRSFGDGIQGDFLSLVHDIIKDPTQFSPSGSNSGFIWRGERRRYSVMDLLQELKKENVKIRFMNDRYERVSPRTIDKSGNNIQYLDKAGEITSISVAKTKPSVSISFKAHIDITTPTGIVYKDFTTPKRIGIMKNGSLNTNFLCIHTDNKKLIGKFKRVGILYTELFGNDYILDLSKIPLTTKKDIKVVLYWMLSEYEYYYQCYKLQEEYVKYKIGENNLEVREEIDVDKKIYNPKTVTRESNTSYVVQVMETKIHSRGFPKTSTERLIAFKNCATLSQDSVAYNLIQEIENNPEQDLQVLLKNVHKKVDHYTKLLADARFHLMLSKDRGFRFGIGCNIYNQIRNVKGRYGDLQLSWNCKKTKEYSYN